jgi:glycosyltransferase involved in cell wall biosynthesis
MTRVLVVAFEDHPSTRLRILQYIPRLEQHGLGFEVFLIPYGRRADMHELTASVEAADVVFVQRVVDRDVLRVLRKSARPVVYDLDDGVHYVRQSQYWRTKHPRELRERLIPVYRQIFRGGKYYSSQRRLLKEMTDLATAMIVGNEWLRDDLGLDSRAVVLPTAVWLDMPVKRHQQHVPITVGWVGVRSNLFHLGLLDEAFRALHTRHGDHLELVVVSSEEAKVPALRTRFCRWRLEDESDSVLDFDIGIMPLQDDPFSRAKCAFKAILCMAHGVPVVASPVGANASLIRSGDNGFLASSTAEWVASITALAEDALLRAEIGKRARATIERDFNAAVVAPELARVLTSAVSNGAVRTA